MQLEMQGILERSKLVEKNEFVLMEMEENKEQICEELIEEYVCYYNLSKKELLENKEKLKELVRKLKLDYSISYRIMEKKLNIGRETLRKLF